jgi:hypothetical protein
MNHIYAILFFLLIIISPSTIINAQQQLIKDVEKISQNIQSDYFLSYINDDVAIPKSDLHVRIVPENSRKDFYEGENIRFWIKSNQDCFIKNW